MLLLWDPGIEAHNKGKEVCLAMIARIFDHIVVVSPSLEDGVGRAAFEVSFKLGLIIVDKVFEAEHITIVDKVVRSLLKLLSCRDFDSIGAKPIFHGKIKFWHRLVGRMRFVPVVAKDPVPEGRIAIRAVRADKLYAVLCLLG